ncbi:MAG: AHH domain-containing protein [Planctomycetes bacterium]|nr:AHH domain-containing protein [Planctomycetota bacterium]
MDSAEEPDASHLGMHVTDSLQDETESLAHSDQDETRSLAHSEVLGASLEAAGEPRPEGHDAHHIVPSDHSNPHAARCREILQRDGVNINDKSNGIWLPHAPGPVSDAATSHSHVHTKVYFENLCARLEGAPDGGSRDVLSGVKRELQDGTFRHYRVGG